MTAQPDPARIQRLIDADDIRTLLAKYCHGIDKHDEATFMSIWAADGVYELPRGEGSGADGIRQLVQKVWREVTKCHHHITNPVIQIDGDHAAATTDVIYFRETADGVLSLLSGVYTLALTKASGEWKISRLSFTSFWTASPAFGPVSNG